MSVENIFGAMRALEGSIGSRAGILFFAGVFALTVSYGLPAGAAGSDPPPNASTSASYCLLPASNTSGGGPLQNGGATVVVNAILGDAIPQGVPGTTVSGYSYVPGFTGQNVDIASIAVNAAPATVDELGTRQLVATATMDDATTTDLNETELLWSVVSGPVSGIDGNGLATGGIVFENTAATVQGDFGAFSDQFGLTVLDVDPDNYLSYGGDGIDDDWQVNFFGAPPNADAGAAANPDGDPNDNRLEFLSGFSPVDSKEFFQFTPLGFSGATTLDLELNKVIPDRTYRVYESATLTGFTSLVGTLSPVLEENDKIFQDTTAGGNANYYRVEISKP